MASRGGVGRHACRAEGKRQQYQCAERHQGPFSAESAPAVSEDSEFCVRPGKAKRSKAQGRNARGLVAEVLRVAAIHSSGRRTGGGPRRGGQSSFGRGRTAFARSRLFGSGRRVMVKMLPVTTRSRGGRRMAPLSAHVAYLKREGVTRDGSPTRMFDAAGDNGDGTDAYPPLNKLTKERLTEMLVGYQEGSYGGANKRIMQVQVEGMNKGDMQKLSDFVTKLKPKEQKANELQEKQKIKKDQQIDITGISS